MGECDNCGSDVQEVWRHREVTETMTHRTVAWVCRSCHPTIPETVTAAESSNPVAMTDGGGRTAVCPSCGGPTVDGQGLMACRECRWSGTA